MPRGELKIRDVGADHSGGNGITLEYPAMRYANNLESMRTYDGTDEVHILILGNAITSISTFHQTTACPAGCSPAFVRAEAFRQHCIVLERGAKDGTL